MIWGDMMIQQVLSRTDRVDRVTKIWRAVTDPLMINLEQLCGFERGAPVRAYGTDCTADAADVCHNGILPWGCRGQDFSRLQSSTIYAPHIREQPCP